MRDISGIDPANPRITEGYRRGGGVSAEELEKARQDVLLSSDLDCGCWEEEISEGECNHRDPDHYKDCVSDEVQRQLQTLEVASSLLLDRVRQLLGAEALTGTAPRR